jgi:hypothetical protein
MILLGISFASLTGFSLFLITELYKMQERCEHTIRETTTEALYDYTSLKKEMEEMRDEFEIRERIRMEELDNLQITVQILISLIILYIGFTLWRL